MEFQKVWERFFLGGLILLTTTAFVKEKEAIVYTGRDHRDPTISPLLIKPSVKTEEPVVQEVIIPPSLTIQGIIWGGNIPRAIVNGQVVAKGDSLPEGVEILDISKGFVKVIYHGKIFTLHPKGASE